MARRSSASNATAQASRSSLTNLAKVSSTQLQNRFGSVLDDLRASGAIVIERHDRPAAVLVTVEEYARLYENSRADTQLDVLSREFDALVQRMQTPEATAGIRKAFTASTELMAAVAAPIIRASMTPGRTRPVPASKSTRNSKRSDSPAKSTGRGGRSAKRK